MCRATLEDPSDGFRVRTLMCIPDPPMAKVFAEREGEVVGTDLDDAEILGGAFAGAYDIYGVTNLLEHTCQPAFRTREVGRSALQYS